MSPDERRLLELRARVANARVTLQRDTGRVLHELSDPLHVRQHVREHPLAALGTAAAAGYLAGGALVPGGDSDVREGTGGRCPEHGRRRVPWNGLLRAVSLAASLRAAAAED